MAKPDHHALKVSALLEVSAALTGLRDALLELSVAMKDWQFETDTQRRAEAGKYVQRLLDKIASPHKHKDP
jgi:hypothetical protein